MTSFAATTAASDSSLAPKPRHSLDRVCGGPASRTALRACWIGGQRASRRRSCCRCLAATAAPRGCRLRFRCAASEAAAFAWTPACLDTLCSDTYLMNLAPAACPYNSIMLMRVANGEYFLAVQTVHVYQVRACKDRCVRFCRGWWMSCELCGGAVRAPCPAP